MRMTNHEDAETIQRLVLLGDTTPLRLRYARPDAEAVTLAHQSQVPEFVQHLRHAGASRHCHRPATRAVAQPRRG